MNRTEAIKQLSEELNKMLIETLDKNLRSCINCINFDNEKEVCCLYNQRPPARIIARGCEKWLYDEVPF